MQIAIGADHAGFEVKEKIKKQLEGLGIKFEDLGTYSTDSVDYPDFAKKVGEAVAKGEAKQGILVCGSGIGISIAANKINGIRAALVWNAETARLSRQHNDANVLVVGARTTPEGNIPKIVEAWFDAEFEGGRHAKRVDKMMALEDDLADTTAGSC
ncbi:MAG: ribose 5-phosphate isomerase B [Acidobacteria bacterium]|nr:ribose 5-phosphate isomerase B [Acidobacteriota bacterium]